MTKERAQRRAQKRARKRLDGRLPFLVVARTPPGQHPHPVEVAVHPAGAASRVSFSVGHHVVNVGGQVALSHVLDETQSGLNPMFDEEFEAAQLHWLVPYLVRLQAGEDVKGEIVAAYRERHGRSPEVMPQQRYGV